MQQQKRGIRQDSKVAHICSPNNSLEDKEAIKKVAIARENLRTGKFILQDVKLLTAFAAAIIMYKNGQGLGVADNLTLDEFELQRDHSKEQVVIPCVNHKRQELLVVQSWWYTKMIWAIF